MRWENLVTDIELQWEREDANAHWDENRERERADRAQMLFRDVLLSEYRRIGSLDIVVREVNSIIHVARVGRGWIDGFECVTGQRTLVVPATATLIDTRRRCRCNLPLVTDLANVTVGAALRQLERRCDTVHAAGAGRSMVGRVTAVWADSFRLANRLNESVVYSFNDVVLSVLSRA
jgi:hypothetical protein